MEERWCRLFDVEIGRKGPGHVVSWDRWVFTADLLRVTTKALSRQAVQTMFRGQEVSM